MSILDVQDVSIVYLTGDFKEIGLKEYILRKLRHDYHVTEFWADRHITFSLERGEMLGIIGVNGAGKSTLLKVISGIMEPSEGTVHREGNIAALLELGSGFDGELTVRENTYLRGAMLGYTRKFMDDTYDSIIDFAELREFENRPFKQLSSGMKSRLAFSIACLIALLCPAPKPTLSTVLSTTMNSSTPSPSVAERSRSTISLGVLYVTNDAVFIDYPPNTEFSYSMMIGHIH